MVDQTNPPVIQRIAPGLLQFLGIKNLGRGNPSHLSETMQGTLELGPLIFSGGYEYLQNSVNVNALGPTFFTAPMLVPTTETWLVWRMGITASTLAAESISIALGLLPGNSSPFMVLGPFDTAVVVAGGSRAACLCLDVPLLAPPGSLFATHVKQITTAGVIACTASAVITRLSP